MDELKNTCWSLFCSTGEISYYMLYYALKEETEEIGSDKV